MQLRLLPLVVIASLLLFAAKTAGLIEETQQLSSIFWITDLNAKTAEEKPPAEDAPEDESQPQISDEANATDTGEGATPNPSSALEKAPLFSPEEVDVLTRLSQRRHTLDEREQNIILRETTLQATEQKINQKLSELKQLHMQTQEILALYNEKEEIKILRLVKIYESMKAKDAARIFEKMDLSILLEVISKMKEAKAAPVLAKMTPLAAKEVTIALAKRRSLPDTTRQP